MSEQASSLEDQSRGMSTSASRAVPEAPADVPGPPQWWRRLVAANPFYLASVTVLLYGLYRVATDPHFLDTEVQQLFFSYTALQSYEWLLVGTAILLVRRLVWYDATLLMILDNAILVVPFILVSQAALIEYAWVWTFCLAAILLAGLRIGALKRYVPELNLPSRTLVPGLLLLAANAALTVVYRVLQESKYGNKPDFGAAFQMNEWSWWLILPSLVLTGLLLPPPRAGGPLCLQRRWVPRVLWTAWMTATAVHLYALSYVYDFDLRAGLAAPGLVAAAWVLQRRLTDLVVTPPSVARGVVLVLPLGAALVAGLSSDLNTLTLLATLNALGYATLGRRGPERALAGQLALASAILAIAALPPQWRTPFLPQPGLGSSLAGALVCYAAIGGLASRHPGVGLLGGGATGALALLLLSPAGVACNWGLQFGCAYVLLHSLRWEENRTPGTHLTRWVVAGVWVVHAAATTTLGAPSGFGLLAGYVLAVWALVAWVRHDWNPLAVPAAAGLVLLSGHLLTAVRGIASLPAGPLAVLTSFLLLGLGTSLALTKHRWYWIDPD